jgi:F0F1-type ATP synthase assembly protein I
MNERREIGEARRTQAIGGGEFAGLGLQFALVILVFTAAGIWLDKRLGTSPWFVVIGVFAGATGGFYSMYRKISMAQRRDERAREARRTNPHQ